MPHKSRKLRIVGADAAATASMSSEIAEAISRWTLLDERLQNLNILLDQEISYERVDKSKVNELQSVITEVQSDQSASLSEIASLPATSLHDIHAKLRVWAHIVMPESNSWIQPADRLVASALADLTDKINES